jgi:hypothetical protein
MRDGVHRIAVDHSEERSLIERKSAADLAASLVDGRLFPQVARLAHSNYRTLLLIEGSMPPSIPDVHPHSVEGALVSIAAMWRLPILQSSDSEQSVRMLRFLADQVRGRQEPILRRFDRKPKRLASRRLFLLQGLPGVGPALAHRLLGHFGSIERVVPTRKSIRSPVSTFPRGSECRAPSVRVPGGPLRQRVRRCSCQRRRPGERAATVSTFTEGQTAGAGVLSLAAGRGLCLAVGAPFVRSRPAARRAFKPRAARTDDGDRRPPG